MLHFPKFTGFSLTLATVCLAVTPAWADQINIGPAQPMRPAGLYLVSGSLTYNDGDVLTGDFRVYCPTATIRPTNYVLYNRRGQVKKSGAWWEPAFKARYKAERLLIQAVCY